MNIAITKTENDGQNRKVFYIDVTGMDPKAVKEYILGFAAKFNQN